MLSPNHRDANVSSLLKRRNIKGESREKQRLRAEILLNERTERASEGASEREPVFPDRTAAQYGKTRSYSKQDDGIVAGSVYRHLGLSDYIQ